MNAAATSERAAIACLLLESARVLPVFAEMGLQTPDFMDAGCRRIFQAALELNAGGRPVDAVTIGDALPGAFDTIAEILETDVSIVNAGEYVGLVLNSSRKRQLGALAKNIEAAAGNGRAVEDTFQDIEVAVAALRGQAHDLASIDAADWLDTEPPQPDQIFEELFDRGDKCGVISSAKRGKTHFVSQLALSLAAGVDFLLFRNTIARRVLIAQFEVKGDHFHRRIKRLCETLNITRADIGGRLRVINGRGMTGESIIPKIGTEAKRHRAEIIIFDPLYKIASGDENAAHDMKPVLAAFDRLAEATGAAVLYVHHDAKGQAGDRDIRDRGAGSNIQRRDDDCTITLSAHDSEENAVVIETLLRNYKPREPFTAVWENGCFHHAPAMPAVKRTSSSRSTASAKPELESYREAALKLLAKKPLTMAAFREKVETLPGMTNQRQRRLVEMLLSESDLAEHHERGRGFHKAWIGTPDQINELQRV